MNARWRVVTLRLSLVMTLAIATVFFYQKSQPGYDSIINQVWIPLLGYIALPFEIPSWTVVAVGFILTPLLVAFTWCFLYYFDRDKDVFTRVDFTAILVWGGAFLGYITGLRDNFLSGLAGMFLWPSIFLALMILGILARILFRWTFAIGK